MALGRFLSGVVATKLHSWIIIKIGTGVMGVALILLCLPINGAVPGIALFLIGLGNGPLFPNFSYLTPENFGEALSPAIMGMGIFPIYLMAFFVIMVMAMLRAGVVFNKRYQ